MQKIASPRDKPQNKILTFLILSTLALFIKHIEIQKDKLGEHTIYKANLGPVGAKVSKYIRNKRSGRGSCCKKVKGAFTLHTKLPT